MSIIPSHADAPVLDTREGDRPEYTFQEALEASTAYFNGDELAATVWVSKYALKDSQGRIFERTPDDMHRRLAGEFARIEQRYVNPMSEEEIYALLRGFRYIVPQGSPMAGIGNNHQISSLSNCYVIGVNVDSYAGIIRTDEEQVQLMKRRGGVGHDLSHIRPKGSPVLNSALTSSGIVPFMERYSNSTREVAQDGRRGALMLTISSKHPDAEDFINAKLEQGKVTGANVSVRIDDEFMRAATSRKPYRQQFPVDAADPKVVKEIDAAALWQKIIYNAWKSAEPGVLFWDTVIRESVPDCYADLGYQTISTNPCVTADTWVMTAQGPRQVHELIGVTFDALVNGNPYRTESNGFFFTGKKEVFELVLGRGQRLKLTADHLVLTPYGWVQAAKLKPGARVCLPNHREFAGWTGQGNYHEGYLIGSLLGDGTFSEGSAKLTFWQDQKDTMLAVATTALAGSGLKHRADAGSAVPTTSSALKYNRTSIKSKALGSLAKSLGIDSTKILKVAIERTSSEFYRGFLAGWFDADGTVSRQPSNNTYAVRYSSSTLINLQVAQRMLARLGIISTIFENRRQAGFRFLPDGCGGSKAYWCEAQHELHIGRDNLARFVEIIGCKNPAKHEKLQQILANYERGPYAESFTAPVVSCKSVGIENVYDCTVADVHEFDANGLRVHNCGEIPLCPYDSCRLIAINLYSYVEHPFQPNARFDFDKFRAHVRCAQRLMDDLIDLEIEKIERILAKVEADPEPEDLKQTEIRLWKKVLRTCLEGRRTGLGITAEGDMLAALGLRYGSEEAIAFAVEVQRALALSAYGSSVEMARERGAFNIYDSRREADNPFIRRLREADPALYEQMAAHGRRNIALLTIAPTGTTSLMTQTTSGIEPVFLVSYLRRRKVNPGDREANVTFVDEVGDSWEEYRVFHHKFADWLQAQGYDVEKIKYLPAEQVQPILEASPYFQATANDVDWLQKVKLQGAVQQWVDHSISVTVNVPENTTVDMVKKIYETAWEAGCKGCTIYRDGSRSGVLVSESKSEKKETANGQSNGTPREHLPPKRPQVLDAEVVRFKNNDQRWIGVVGLYEGRPYEIFTGRAEDTFRLPDYVQHGWVIKNRDEDGRNRYDFRFQDKEGYKVTIEGLSRSFNQEYWNYAKLISGVLRLGMPIPQVVNLVEGLNVEDQHINTWKNGVLRALKRHIPDGTKVGKQACPNCNDTEHLVYKEGCLTCESCGYSKCG